MDSTLCNRASNAINIDDKTTYVVDEKYGSCCFLATVDNVNLENNSLTITFEDTPPTELAAQIVLPANSVVYNCGLCYTNGLGTNLPTLGFERGDTVLCLVPLKATYTVNDVKIVGHEFELGVEDQKHCGQMNRMIIQPGSDYLGTDGYGSPFVNDGFDADGNRECTLVNPVNDIFLKQLVAQGTLNGGADRHMMIFGDSDGYVGVRPYMFPNGANLNGVMEHEYTVNDGQFPYGCRLLVSDQDVVASYYSLSVDIEAERQESRSIGTNNSDNVLSVILGSEAVDISGSTYRTYTPLSRVFGTDPLTSDILIKNESTGGIVRHLADFNSVDLSFDFSASELYLDESSYYDPINWHKWTNTQVDSKWQHQNVSPFTTVSFTDYFYSISHNTINDTITTLTSTENVLTVRNKLSYSYTDDYVQWTDSRVGVTFTTGTRGAEHEHFVEISINGNTLGKCGAWWDYTYTWDAGDYDGSSICSGVTDGPPPTLPVGTQTLSFSGHVYQSGLMFLHLDIDSGLAVFIRWTATMSKDQSGLSAPNDMRAVDFENVPHEMELCLYKDGSVVVLDTYSKTGGATSRNWGDDPTNSGIFDYHQSVGSYYTHIYPNWGLYSPPWCTIDITGPGATGGVTWTAPSGSTCNWSANYIQQHQYDIIFTTQPTKSNSARVAQKAQKNNIGIYMGQPTFVDWMLTGGSFQSRVCPVRLVPFYGTGTQPSTIGSLFNEFAKSDNGDMIYFSVPKLSKIEGLASAQDDYIRVFVHGNTVSLNGEAKLEDATGFTHSQSGLRFAPYQN